MYFIIGWLAYIVKHLGQTNLKERKRVFTMGLGIVMMKRLKTLRVIS